MKVKLCKCPFSPKTCIIYVSRLCRLFLSGPIRYILIATPSWYDKIYRRPLIAAMIAGAWLFSFGMMTPSLVGVWGQLGLKEVTFSCTILRGNDGKSPKKFLFIFGFLIPCLTIIVSYTCIFIKVRQSRKNVRSHR